MGAQVILVNHLITKPCIGSMREVLGGYICILSIGHGVMCRGGGVKLSGPSGVLSLTNFLCTSLFSIRNLYSAWRYHDFTGRYSDDYTGCLFSLFGSVLASVADAGKTPGVLNVTSSKLHILGRLYTSYGAQNYDRKAFMERSRWCFTSTFSIGHMYCLLLIGY